MGGSTGVRADPFVGRADELRALLALHQTVAAGAAITVIVEGVAGVGKSRFVDHVLDVIGDRSTVIRLRATGAARDDALGLLRPLVAEASSPFATGMALVARLTEEPNDRPVVLVVDDVHLADVASAQALLVAIRRLERDRVMVLLTARSGELSSDASWERLRSDPQRCVTISLGPFGDADCAALAAAHGIDLEPRAVRRLREHTGGLALYVRTLLAELSPEVLSAPGRLPVSRTLAETTVALVAALPAAARALLEALAVVGGSASLVELQRMAAIDDPTAALDDAIASELVRWSPGPASNAVTFAHPLFAAAIYDDIAPARRGELHLAAARGLDPRPALAHRVAAASGPDECLAGELDRAAADAAAAGQRAAAGRYLLWAAASSAAADRREQRLLAGVRALLDGGERAAAEARRTDVVECPPGPLRSYVLGLLEVRAGQSAAAEAAFTAAAAATHAPDVAASALVQLAYLHTSLVRGERAVEAATAALDLGVLSPTGTTTAHVLLAIGTSHSEGAGRGLEILDRHCPPERLESDEIRALVSGTRGMMRHYAGRAQAAVAALRDALRRPGALGVHLPRVHVVLGRALYDVGSWDDALRHADTAGDLARDDGQPIIHAQARALQATVLAGRAMWVEARAQLDAAQAANAGVPSAEGDLWVRMAAAAVHRARGDAAAVREALQPLHAGPVDRELPAFALTWWPPLVDAFIDLGDADAARRYLGLLGGDRLSTHRARLLALDGDRPGAVDAYRSALAVADRPVLERAIDRQRLAAVLLSLDRRREAVQLLLEARAIVVESGATAYLPAVDQALADAGAPVGPGKTVDLLGGLNTRERQVVQLAVAGRGNREAAAELYLSVKTIEYHLGRAYTKLGVRSRRELLSLLREHAEVSG